MSSLAHLCRWQVWCGWLCSQKPPNSWKGRLVHVVAAVQVAERKCLGGEWYMATGLIHPLRFSGTNAGLYTEGKWCSLCLRCG